MRGIEKLERITIEIPWDLYLKVSREQRGREDKGCAKSECTKRAIIIEWMEAGAKLAEGGEGKG